jgi:hypothetical protein
VFNEVCAALQDEHDECNSNENPGFVKNFFGLALFYKDDKGIQYGPSFRDRNAIHIGIKDIHGFADRVAQCF